MHTSLILVPIDFSPHAERALDYAITLAKKLSAQIHFASLQLRKKEE